MGCSVCDLREWPFYLTDWILQPYGEIQQYQSTIKEQFSSMNSFTSSIPAFRKMCTITVAHVNLSDCSFDSAMLQSCYCSHTDLTSCYYLSAGCLISMTCLSWDAHCAFKTPGFLFVCVVYDFLKYFVQSGYFLKPLCFACNLNLGILYLDDPTFRKGVDQLNKCC